MSHGGAHAPLRDPPPSSSSLSMAASTSTRELRQWEHWRRKSLAILEQQQQQHSNNNNTNNQRNRNKNDHAWSDTARRASVETADAIWQSLRRQSSINASSWEDVFGMDNDDDNADYNMIRSIQEKKSANNNGPNENDGPAAAGQQQPIVATLPWEDYDLEGNIGADIMDTDNDTAFGTDQPSEISRERAIRRGIRRGALEDHDVVVWDNANHDVVHETNQNGRRTLQFSDDDEDNKNENHNEHHHRRLHYSYSDGGSTTLGGDWTTVAGDPFLQPRPRRRRRRQRRGLWRGMVRRVLARPGTERQQQQYQRQQQQRTAFFQQQQQPSAASPVNSTAANNEAWMCGVCGKAFGSLAAATEHETAHIRQVVDNLPWAPRGNGRNQSALLESSSNHHEGRGSQNPEVANNNATTDRTNHRMNSWGFLDSPRLGVETPTNNSKNHRQSSSTANHGHGTTFDQPGTTTPLQEEIDREFDARLSEFQASRQEIFRPLDDIAEGHDDDGDDKDHPSPVKSVVVVPPPAVAATEAVAAAPHPSGRPPLSPVLRPPTFSEEYCGGSPDAPRVRSSSEVRFDETAGSPRPLEPEELLLPHTVQESASLVDQALLDVCQQAEPLLLTPAERRAERDLALLEADSRHYRHLLERAIGRQQHPTSRFRSEETGLWSKAQNKMLDAYQIMKEGDGPRGVADQYTRRGRRRRPNASSVGGEDTPMIRHSDGTLYVNVMVKNSIQVVQHELERLARRHWETNEGGRQYTRFERFREYAHSNFLKLAGIALASDFTPRRIAIHLSNDLYRLLTPRLQRRGVQIETEIEYRVGPFFVIAVNIQSIQWRRLIRATYKDVRYRKARWEKERILHEQQSSQEHPAAPRGGRLKEFQLYINRLSRMSKYDILAQLLAWLYHLHWTLYMPICMVCYYTVWGSTIRQFIISSVTDEIFFYVEKKGMEMEIDVRGSSTQAAFMLSALREIRADGRELQRKRQEAESAAKGTLLGPLLGPAIPADAVATAVADDTKLSIPDNLEFVGLEIELPVGFRRLRWALLSSESRFLEDALFQAAARYENIALGAWEEGDSNTINTSTTANDNTNDNNNLSPSSTSATKKLALDWIGHPDPPASLTESDFVGASREGSHLMPKSAFVKANMSYEVHQILAYNDHCFSIKKKSRNPDAPYGSTFVAWTQMTVINNSHNNRNSCRMICSVEPEFPNGRPLVSRQIQSGMRAGVSEFFVLLGQTITQYADEFP